MQNDFFFTKNDFNMKNKWIRFYTVGQRKLKKNFPDQKTYVK